MNPSTPPPPIKIPPYRELGSLENVGPNTLDEEASRYEESAHRAIKLGVSFKTYNRLFRKADELRDLAQIERDKIFRETGVLHNLWRSLSW
jgi:hypothetical protein